MPVDGRLWARGMIESESAPPVCPILFKDVAETVLRATLGLSVDDITHTNCRNNIFTLGPSHKMACVQWFSPSTANLDFE